MKVVIQRVLSSSVEVDHKIVGQINQGLTLLIGFHKNDDVTKLDKIIQKIIHLRIFDDSDHVMNQSVLDIDGQILSVSQFTLYADTKKVIDRGIVMLCQEMRQFNYIMNLIED